MMHKIIILIGTGEMAGVFARGFLRQGFTVVPVLRDSDISSIATHYPQPQLVLIAVGENDLHAVLRSIPENWKSRLGLLQNELLPDNWLQFDIQQPSVISVWFEKKKGQDYKVLIPSPCFGPQAALFHGCLTSLGISCTIVDNSSALLFELVRKNIYILTTNIAGLRVGGNVEQLWNLHQQFAIQVANEIIDIQDCLNKNKNDRPRLIEGMVEAIKGDLQHNCMGRSAPGRLKRAIAYADTAKLKVPLLREIFQAQFSDN